MSPQTQFFSSRKSGLTEVKHGRSSPLTAHPDPEQEKTIVGSLSVFLLERSGQVVSCSVALDFLRGSLLSEQGQTPDRIFSVVASGDTACVICLFFGYVKANPSFLCTYSDIVVAPSSKAGAFNGFKSFFKQVF